MFLLILPSENAVFLHSDILILMSTLQLAELAWKDLWPKKLQIMPSRRIAETRTDHGLKFRGHTARAAFIRSTQKRTGGWQTYLWSRSGRSWHRFGCRGLAGDSIRRESICQWWWAVRTTSGRNLSTWRWQPELFDGSMVPLSLFIHVHSHCSDEQRRHLGTGKVVTGHLPPSLNPCKCCSVFEQTPWTKMPEIDGGWKLTCRSLLLPLDLQAQGRHDLKVSIIIHMAIENFFARHCCSQFPWCTMRPPLGLRPSFWVSRSWGGLFPLPGVKVKQETILLFVLFSVQMCPMCQGNIIQFTSDSQCHRRRLDMISLIWFRA